MYIRLDVSGNSKRSVPAEIISNSCFPLTIERGLISDVFPHLSSDAVNLYIILLNYDTLSAEFPTPTLDRMKEINFPLWTEEQFRLAISELTHVSVNGKQLVCLN